MPARPPSPSRTLTPGLLLALLCGCQFDASVQGVPRIRCTAPSECPAGMVCRGSVELCLPTSPPETVAPALEERLVFPSVGTLGQRFSLGFRVTEPLLVPPRLHLLASDGRELSGIETDGSDLPDREYRSFYRAPSEADAGVTEGPVRVTVDLIDSVGNASDRLEVGAFTLDFTPPEVVAQAAEVSLTPGSGNPLPVVTALGEGSTALISFVATEALVDPVLTPSVPGLQLVRTGGELNSFVFTGFLADAGHLETEVALDLDATDRAGNPIKLRRLQLRPPLRIDTLAPAAPSTQTPGAIVYTRAPNGVLNGRAAWFEVAGEGGSAEPLATLVVREPGSDATVAQGAVRDGGSFGPLSLGLADRGNVLVSAIDSAGNESPRVRVSDVRYVASLRDKVPGSTAANPHRLDLRRFFGPALTQKSQFEASGLPTSVDVSGAWRRRYATLPGPGSFVCASFATDLARRRVVALPWSGAQLQWEWDGNDWRIAFPADPEGDGHPPATRSVLGFDEGLQQLVAITGTQFGTDTWVFAGNSWRKLGGGPPAVPIAMTWSPLTGRLTAMDLNGILYGFTGNGWQYLSQSLGGAAVAIGLGADRLRGDLLTVDSAGKTYAFDAGWVALDAGVAIAYQNTSGHFRLLNDATTGALLLAVDKGGGVLQLLRWQGVSAGWGPATEVAFPFSWDACPALAAWDSSREALLVHDTVQPQTFGVQLDGGVVLLRDATFAAPFNAASAAGVYSEQHRALALAVPNPTGNSTALWTFDGQRFTALPSVPERRSFAGLAEDPLGQALWLHGGKLADGGTSGTSWRYTVAGGWQSDAGGPGPAVAAFAFAREARGLLLQGGLSTGSTISATAVDQTWLLPLDGGSWTLLESSTTDPAAFHQLLCDPATTSCVRGPGASGGNSPGTTWVSPGLDGGQWLRTMQFQPSLAPVAGYGAARDPSLGIGVLFGGRAASGLVVGTPSIGVWGQLRNGTISLEASDDAFGDGQPAPRFGPVLARDPERNLLTLWGGALPDGGALGGEELWELSLGGARPAAVFTVDLERAGLQSPAEVIGLHLNARVFGSVVLVDGGTDERVELRLWVGGRWLPLGLAPSDGGTLDVLNPATLTLAARGHQRLWVAIAPVGGNGRYGAVLRVDDVQALIDYRLP